MADKEARNVNVTIKNQEEEKDEVVISISSIAKKLKKYFLPWVIIAAMVGVLLVSMSVVAQTASKPPLQALVCFTFDGIEKGLDPNGNTFDVNTLKSPSVIEDALSELNKKIDIAEKIRQDITIEGIIPSDAIDRITAYKSIYETGQSGNLQAAQAMLDVTYYPTQYKVIFDYADTRLSKDEAVSVINTILDKYRDYFYDQYGYNETLGASVSAINYQDYDYSEAVDLFSSTLTTLQKYIKQLSNEDETRFRSSMGYTFDDLYQAVNTVKTIDLDMLSSKITVNNLTRDKQQTLNYYTYRIDDLNRLKDQYTESLAAVTDSISSYQKDTLLVMQSSDGANSEITQTSKEYDDLIERKVEISNSLAETNNNIAFYTARKKQLESAPEGSADMAKGLDEDFEKLNTKVQNLVALIRDTSDEYYEKVELANSYSVLVPAVNSAGQTIVSIIQGSLKGVIIAEAIIFVIYFAVAFFTAIVAENRKKPVRKAVAAGDDDDAEDDTDDSSDEEAPAEENAVETKAEEKKPEPKKPAVNKNSNNKKKK